MTKVYDGQWLDLVLITGGSSHSRHREIWASMPLHNGAYQVPPNGGALIIDEWNANDTWDVAWAKRADQIHTAFRSGDKALVRELIRLSNEDLPSFVQTKTKALHAYEAWAA